MTLINELKSPYGNETFRTGFGVGARIVFEIMAKKNVGSVGIGKSGKIVETVEENETGEEEEEEKE